MKECPLLVPEINYALAGCWRVAEEHPLLFSGASDVNLVYSSSSREVLITTRKGSMVTAQALLEPGARLSAASFSEKGITSSPIVSDDIMGIKFRRTSSTFYQINIEQNIAMINLVLNYLAPACKQPILDLYCGCGNFSLFLARAGSAVVGIDANSHAIAEALHNSHISGLHGCSFRCGKVEQHLQQLAAHEFSAALLNPSRQGCSSEVLAHIARIKPHSIVYVSCNPAVYVQDGWTYPVEHGDTRFTIVKLDCKQQPDLFTFSIPEGGWVLYPGKLYLGATIEHAGSDHYIPMIEGRSSLARLGLSVHQTGGFGDLGFQGQWTLEFTCVEPLRIYAGMQIAQVQFWECTGPILTRYKGKYSNQAGPTPSKLYKEMAHD